MTDNIPKLASIIIGVTDMPKAKEFYISLFGIRIDDDQPNYVSAFCPDGIHIELEKDTDERFPSWAERNTGTYKCSEFSVTNIHDFLKKVVSLGGEIVTPPQERSWGGYGAEFSDPDHNIFLITQKQIGMKR